MTRCRKHDFSFLQIFSTKVSFSCSKCGKEVLLDDETAEEVRRITRKELRRHQREGLKTLRKVLAGGTLSKV